MRKLLSTMLALCLLLGLTSGVSAQEAAQSDIVILFTNDIHCAVQGDIGISGVAALKRQLIKEGNAVALVDNGDAVQGEAIGTLSKGASIVELMNAAGYDIGIPGNHEFDYGMDRFFELVEMAEYKYISSNFMNLTTGISALDACTILELGGKKIGFVGISTPKSITSSTPTYFQNENGEYIYGFCQDEDGTALYENVQTTVDALRTEDVDYVIALAHLGIEAECAPWMSTDVILNTTGIDVVLDGHSHSTIENEWVKNKEGKEVLLASTGTKLSSVGKLTIKPDGTIASALVYYKDSGVTAKVNDIFAQHQETLNTVVAKTEVPLVINDPDTLDKEQKVRLIRNAETNLGDLCADAYRFVSGADVAVVNGGGIRTDIFAGDITYNNIINVHPYGNELCVVEVTGQQILDALEMGARVTDRKSTRLNYSHT